MPGQEQAARAELRCPDPSCNPYLAFTAMLAAGLDGIDRQFTPPEPLNNVNVYELEPDIRLQMGIEELPGSLLEALNELARDEVLQQSLGSEVYAAFQRAKLAEWDEYRTHVTDWEIEHYLELT